MLMVVLMFEWPRRSCTTLGSSPSSSTMREAAAVLGMTVKQLRSLADSGRIATARSSGSDSTRGRSGDGTLTDMIAEYPWSGAALKRLSRHIRDGTPSSGNHPSYADVMLWFNDLAARVGKEIGS